MPGYDVITEPASAERVWADWDRLAIASARPYAAPGWQLGWWAAAAPAGAQLAVVVAQDAGAVVGVLGLFRERTRTGIERLRLLGAPLAQGTGPAVEPGREREAARGFAAALAGLRPRPATLHLEGVLGGRRWAALVAGSWSSRARPLWLPEQVVDAPLGQLEGGSLDGWLRTRSSGFRQQMRRSRRKLEERGASFSRATSAEDVEAALADLLRLHHARWEDRGGSQAVDDRTHAALAQAARRLGGPDGRMHVELIHLDGQVISAHLFVSAGEETTYWLGGFEDEYGSLRPGLVALVEAADFGIARGVRRFDLGPGVQQYKMRFADGTRALDWGHLLLPGPRLPLTGAQLGSRLLARRAVHAGRERLAARSGAAD